MGSHQLTPRDMNDLYRYFDRSAFRLETLPQYLVEGEQESFEKFLRGEEPDVVDVHGFHEWLGWVLQATAAGKQIERVRVLSEPPTDYQRWEARIGRHNEAAGEKIRYIEWSRAVTVGLPVERGDWWLLDSARVISLRFDDEGRPMGSVLSDDGDLVRSCVEWHNLAFKHSSAFHELRTLQA